MKLAILRFTSTIVLCFSVLVPSASLAQSDPWEDVEEAADEDVPSASPEADASKSDVAPSPPSPAATASMSDADKAWGETGTEAGAGSGADGFGDEGFGDGGFGDGGFGDGGFSDGGIFDSDLKLNFVGTVQSDLRFRVEERSMGGFWDKRTLPVGVARNENLLGGKLSAAYGSVSAQADIDFVLYGVVDDVQSVEDLSRGERIDPYRFDVHQLYIQVKDLGFHGLDLRIGQQLVLWGVGDQFNPTNNLNSDDLEDPLLFGQQRGNFMVKLDYWIDGDWSLSGVAVPVFKPASLPRSGELALAAVDRLPAADEELRWRLHTEAAAARSLINVPTTVKSTTVELPETSIENVQLAYRIAGVVADQDVALSYYYGRHDFPVANKTHTTLLQAEQCSDVTGNCISGLLENAATVHYPRMHVYGFNMEGEIGLFSMLTDAIKPIGYRLEAALIVPKRTTIELTNDELALGVFNVPSGEYDYDADGNPGGPNPVVIEDTPFAKWSLGFDYSFGKWVYANVQWVHGLPSEFGAGDWISEGHVVRAGGIDVDSGALTQCAFAQNGEQCAYEILKPRIGDYLVAGIDFRFADQKALIRMFTVLDLVGVDITRWDQDAGKRITTHHPMFSEKGYGIILYPEMSYTFSSGLELGGGVLAQLGKPYGVFGDPAAGGSVVWSRARFRF